MPRRDTIPLPPVHIPKQPPESAMAMTPGRNRDTPVWLRPSPPAVMVDMLGAILNVIVTPVAAVRDDLLIVETVFRDSSRTVEGRFWVLPDPALRDLGA